MKNIISLCVILFALSACVGSSKPTTFYSLKAIPDKSQTFSVKNHTKIGILHITIPEYVDIPQIVLLDSNSIRVKKDEFSRWIEDLASLLQRTLTEDITENLPKSIVKDASNSTKDFDFLIEIAVTKFDGSFGQQAHLNVLWSIYDAKHRHLMTKQTKLEEKIGNTYDSYALAQSNMLGKLSAEIAKTVATLQINKANKTDDLK